jgi:hypothetical protein
MQYYLCTEGPKHFQSTFYLQYTARSRCLQYLLCTLVGTDTALQYLSLQYSCWEEHARYWVLGSNDWLGKKKQIELYDLLPLTLLYNLDLSGY